MLPPDADYLNFLLAQLPLLSSHHIPLSHQLLDSIRLLASIPCHRLTPPPLLRGRPPHPPHVMLRSLCLAALLCKAKLNAWAALLRQSPLFRVLIGLLPDATPPSASSHYRFIYRLTRDSQLPHHALHTARSFTRDLTQESQNAHIQPAPFDSITDWLHHQLLHLSDASALPHYTIQASPWLSVLFDLGIEPLISCQAFQEKLSLHLDGTIHESHANPFGKHIDNQNNNEQDTSDTSQESEPSSTPKMRCYSDPDATFCYSKSKDKHIFGTREVLLSTTIQGYDLPLITSIVPAHHGEAPSSMVMLYHFLREIKARKLPLKASSLAADALFSSKGFYSYLRHHGLAPIIPFYKEENAPKDEHKRDEHGVPLCPQGAPMRRHDQTPTRTTYYCPAMRLTRQKPDAADQRSTYQFQAHRCPQGSPCFEGKTMGPSLTIYRQDDARLDLPVPYKSEAWKELYKARTGVERLFSQRHHAIPHRTYRRAKLWEAACVIHTLCLQHRFLVKNRPREPDPAWDELEALLQRL